MLEAPYNGVLLDAQYRRDVGNPSMTASEQQTWSGYGYLKSVNNTYTIGLDNGVGWAQTPSQGWRNTYDRGAGYPQLLQQYYTGVYLQNQRDTVFNEAFYNNTNCSGSYVYYGTTNSINYDWGYGAPPNRNVGSDYFCALWFQSITIDAADWYTFYIVADDGFKLWVDSTWVLDRWVIQGPTQYTLSLYLTPGQHFLYLQYFENTGMSVIRLS